VLSELDLLLNLLEHQQRRKTELKQSIKRLGRINSIGNAQQAKVAG